MANNVDLLPSYLQLELEEAKTELAKPGLSDLKMAVQKERKRVVEKFIKLFEEFQLLDNQ